MTLAKLQAKLDTKVDPAIRRGRPQKVVADLEKIIGHTQELHSPLVLLWQYNPPSKRYRSWFPGMARRIEVMNQAIVDMVNRINLPNVRVFDAAGLVEKYSDGDLDAATPDGFHYSPELHRKLGEELAREVAEWADSQPHLQVETKRTRARSVRSSERAG
jgi:lysophospholipase L1-like esterase